jgi:hypothetical protein
MSAMASKLVLTLVAATGSTTVTHVTSYPTTMATIAHFVKKKALVVVVNQNVAVMTVLEPVLMAMSHGKVTATVMTAHGVSTSCVKSGTLIMVTAMEEVLLHLKQTSYQQITTST